MHGQMLFLGIHAKNACRAKPQTAVPAGHFFVVKMETLSLGSVRHLLFLHHARYLGLALWFWILRASCQKLQLLLQIHLVTSDKIFQNRLALTLHY